MTESLWSMAHVHAMITFWDHVNAMFEPYLNYIWPNYSSKPAKAPRFSRQSRYALRNMCLGCLFLAPPLPFGQMRSSTSWVLHFLSSFLSPFLSFFLTHSGRKLKISVNIDARTLKFCMRHPWTQSLRFRENQIVCMSFSLLVGLLPF